MKSSTLLAVLLPLCTGMAISPGLGRLVDPVDPNDPSDLSHFVFPQWSIVNFDGGCSPGGCILDFNMSSAATPSGPAVAASCRINGDRDYWQACASLGGDNNNNNNNNNSRSSNSSSLDSLASAVWAVSVPAIDSFTVSVQHRYAVAGANVTRFYNVTANLTVDFEKTRMPLNATVRPSRVAEAWYWLRNVTVPVTTAPAGMMMMGMTTKDRAGAATGRLGGSLHEACTARWSSDLGRWVCT